MIFALALVLGLSACDRGAAAPVVQPTPATGGAPPPRNATPLAVPPPDIPEPSLPSAAEPPRNLDVSVLHLGRLIVALERTSMREIQTQIGAGVFDEQGDGGDWRSWLCYTSPHALRVWIISSQTGSGQFANAFELERDATAEPSAHCPALPAQYLPVVLEPDLHLGTAQRSVETRYGPPQPDGEWSIYRRIDSSNHDSLHFDIAHRLSVRYENGVIAALGARKTTSN